MMRVGHALLLQPGQHPFRARAGGDTALVEQGIPQVSNGAGGASLSHQPTTDAVGVLPPWPASAAYLASMVLVIASPCKLRDLVADSCATGARSRRSRIASSSSARRGAWCWPASRRSQPARPLVPALRFSLGRIFTRFSSPTPRPCAIVRDSLSAGDQDASFGSINRSIAVRAKCANSE